LMQATVNWEMAIDQSITRKFRWTKCRRLSTRAKSDTVIIEQQKFRSFKFSRLSNFDHWAGVVLRHNVPITALFSASIGDRESVLCSRLIQKRGCITCPKVSLSGLSPSLCGADFQT